MVASSLNALPRIGKMVGSKIVATAPVQSLSRETHQARGDRNPLDSDVCGPAVQQPGQVPCQNSSASIDPKCGERSDCDIRRIGWLTRTTSRSVGGPRNAGIRRAQDTQGQGQGKGKEGRRLMEHKTHNPPLPRLAAPEVGTAASYFFELFFLSLTPASRCAAGRPAGDALRHYSLVTRIHRINGGQQQQQQVHNPAPPQALNRTPARAT